MFKKALIITLPLAVIVWLIAHFVIKKETNPGIGIQGKPIAFTLFFEAGDEAWMKDFEAQMNKWNSIHPFFSIKRKVKVNSWRDIPISKTDDINAVGWKDTVLLGPAVTRTGAPTDGKFETADIVFNRSQRSAIEFTPLDPTLCNIGPLHPVDPSANASLGKIRFHQIALHELGHVVGMTEESGFNIMNVNIRIDPQLHTLDKQVGFSVAVTSFGKEKYTDAGVFRGIAHQEDAPKCAHLSKTTVGPHESFTAHHVAVENLSNTKRDITVKYVLGYRDSRMFTLLTEKTYTLKPFTGITEDVNLRIPGGTAVGEYNVRAIIEATDDDPGNNNAILGKITVAHPVRPTP